VNTKKCRRGAALIIALTTLLVVMLITGAIVQTLTADLRESRLTAMQLQAQWLADAAATRAHLQLRANPQYQGETWRAAVAETPGEETAAVGVAEIRVERISSPDKAKLTIQVRFPDHPSRRVALGRDYEVTVSPKPSQAGASPEESAP
jgi:Tfp pilus assembly protein PilX